MSWRSERYRRHVRSFGCAVCGCPDTVAAHVGGIAPRGVATKAPDWCCAPLCEDHHDQLDGRALPELTQAEREDVVRGVVLTLGSFLESLSDSDARREIPKFGQRKSNSKRGPRLKMGERRRP